MFANLSVHKSLIQSPALSIALCHPNLTEPGLPPLLQPEHYVQAAELP